MTVPARARSVLVDGLGEVADDVAVRERALPMWVSVAPVLTSTPIPAFGSFAPWPVEADPVAHDPVALPHRARR